MTHFLYSHLSKQLQVGMVRDWARRQMDLYPAFVWAHGENCISMEICSFLVALFVYDITWIPFITDGWLDVFLGYSPPQDSSYLWGIRWALCAGAQQVAGEIHTMEWEQDGDRRWTSSDTASTASQLPLGKKAQKKKRRSLANTSVCIILNPKRAEKKSLLKQDCGGLESYHCCFLCDVQFVQH